MCDHLNLTVQNLEESVSWYQQVFGFRPVEAGVYRDERGKRIKWQIIRRHQFMLCLYEDPSRKMMAESDFTFHRIYHFGLQIQSRADFEETLKNKKLIPSVYGPFRYPHSTSWYIQDPTGYEIEVALWNEGKIRFTSDSQDTEPESLNSD